MDIKKELEESKRKSDFLKTMDQLKNLEVKDKKAKVQDISKDYLKRFTMPQPYSNLTHSNDKPKHANSNDIENNRAAANLPQPPKTFNITPQLVKRKSTIKTSEAPVVKNSPEIEARNDQISASYIKRVSEHPEERFKKIIPKENK
jgi:hypothetical protein